VKSPPLPPNHLPLRPWPDAYAVAAKARLADPYPSADGGQTRDLVMFNLAIDSKLRGCDVVALRVEDVAPRGYAVDRATVRQKKTGRPVRFELTEQTRQAVIPGSLRTKATVAHSCFRCDRLRPACRSS
jgi:integrase